MKKLINKTICFLFGHKSLLEWLLVFEKRTKKGGYVVVDLRCPRCGTSYTKDKYTNDKTNV